MSPTLREILMLVPMALVIVFMVWVISGFLVTVAASLDTLPR